MRTYDIWARGSFLAYHDPENRWHEGWLHRSGLWGAFRTPQGYYDIILLESGRLLCSAHNLEHANVLIASVSGLLEAVREDDSEAVKWGGKVTVPYLRAALIQAVLEVGGFRHDFQETTKQQVSRV
jgi:hypothetical protein